MICRQPPDRFAQLVAIARQVVAGGLGTDDAVALIENAAPGVTVQEIVQALHMAARIRRIPTMRYVSMDRYSDSDRPARPANKAAEDAEVEIEITPEMIAAGASVLCGLETSLTDEGYWARKVYEAMRMARFCPQ